MKKNYQTPQCSEVILLPSTVMQSVGVGSAVQGEEHNPLYTE